MINKKNKQKKEPDPELKFLASTAKDLRERKTGLTQLEFLNKFGFPIARTETAKRNLNYKSLLRLGECFDEHPGVFFKKKKIS